MTNWKNVLYGLLIFLAVSCNINAIISPVECPGKDVIGIRQQAEQFEVSFLFYHVSWSNESQANRLIYEKIVQEYREKIYFAVIDCYHLACNCSKTHPLLLGSGSPNRWPTLLIRYGQRITLSYNGEWSVNAFNRFIGALFRSVEKICTRDELKVLSMHRDAVVLGVFSDDSEIEYRRFLTASVKWLEIDPENSFRFASAFNTSAADVLSNTNSTIWTMPQLMLITSRGIDVMSSEWQVNNIILWLQTEFLRYVSTLYSYNSPKSLTAHLNLSPVLAVFANDYFYEYMNNLTNPGYTFNSNTHHDELIQTQEIDYIKHIFEQKQLLNPLTCFSKEIGTELNFRYYYALNTYLSNLICELSPGCTNKTETLQSFNNLHITYSSKTQINHPTSKISAAKYLKKLVDSKWLEYKSNQNRSLAIVILDSVKHRDFLKTLGVTHIAIDKFVTMIIADRSKESVFVSQNMFTFDRLLDFVHNYFNNSLMAYKTISNLNINPPLSLGKLLVKNVNSEVFLKKIEQTDFTTIMLLFSPQCMFSALASQALLQLSAQLDNTSGIQIIRLNTLFDELPWEFKMTNTPTLLVFPRGRAAESRLFPMDKKIDVHNIFCFVLAQMEPLDKLKALLSFCRHRKLHSLDMRKCLQNVRTLVYKYISNRKKLRRLSENHNIEKQLTELNEVVLELKTISPFY